MNDVGSGEEGVREREKEVLNRELWVKDIRW